MSKVLSTLTWEVRTLLYCLQFRMGIGRALEDPYGSARVPFLILFLVYFLLNKLFLNKFITNFFPDFIFKNNNVPFFSQKMVSTAYLWPFF